MKKMILYVIAGLIIASVLGVCLNPQFGAASKGSSMEKIKASANYKSGKFQNLNTVEMKTGDQSMPSMLKEFFFGNGVERVPVNPLPSIQVNKEKFNVPGADNIVMSWLGHSTVVIKTANKVIVTDPVFNRASPISFIGPKPFAHSTVNTVADLPEKIDVVLISHDHYDHLDCETIKKLKKRVAMFYVPLGVKAHMLRWGIDDSAVTEFDWYEEAGDESIRFVFAPTQHFGGRGLRDRFKTLWGSWIIKTSKRSVYFSGDSGYFDEFKKIGEKYGPFDIAFIECGAYNKSWAGVHMDPEMTVQTALDLKANVLMPIHNSKYDLSLHSWQEPLDRVLTASVEKGVTLATPMIGEVFSTNPGIPVKRWWKKER